MRNLGNVATVADLEQAVITTRQGVPVTLKDVARVTMGAQVKRGDAGVNGKPGVILSIQKQPGAVTTTLTAELDRAFDDLAASLPPDIQIDRTLFRQANFIESAIDNVQTALRDSTVIVALVLFLFLLNLRTTAITLTAIPLSFFTSAIVMYWFGLSVNTMTLGGLAIAVGEVVDDAIVDVENVFRRLRENRLSPAPRPILQVVFEASSEVRNSIVFATIVVGLAFLPLFFLSGIEGRMFSSLGIAYIVSILASLVVSLTLTPVLCSYLFASVKAIRSETDSALVRFLKRLDLPVIRFGLRHSGAVVIGALVCFLIAGSLFFAMGREFLPPFTEGTLTVNVSAPPGISLDASNAIGQAAEQSLLALPDVASTGRRTGRAELDDHAEGVHNTEIDVVLGPSQRSREEVLEAVRSSLASLQGVTLNVGQPISHRLDHILSGIQAQVAIKLFGPDLDRLRATAKAIEEAIRQVPGVVDVAHRAADADPADPDPHRSCGGRPVRGAGRADQPAAGDRAERTRRLAGDRRIQANRSGGAARRAVPRGYRSAARPAGRRARAAPRCRSRAWRRYRAPRVRIRSCARTRCVASSSSATPPDATSGAWSRTSSGSSANRSRWNRATSSNTAASSKASSRRPA